MVPQMHTILVPTDFTSVADYALEHAAKFSRMLNLEITLLHITKKEDDYKQAEAKITSQAHAFMAKYGIKVHTLIQEGSIFTLIGEIANRTEAQLVVMGTHGMQGMQKITGSWALKVTVTTKAPVIIVQDNPKHDTIKRLVFPLDFKKENKEKIGWACFIAKQFDAKTLIYKSNPKDRSFLQGILTNYMFTEKYFKKHDIDYEVFTAEPKKNFADQTIEFARKVDADMILVMTTKSITYADYIFGASEQYIIANEARIPVMCINPRPVRVGSFSATGC